MLWTLALALAATPVTHDVADWSELRVVQREGRAWLALFEPGHSAAIVDPRTGVTEQTIPGPLNDLIAVDADGDFAIDLMLCSEAGLVVRPWEKRGPDRVLDTRPCHSIALVHADMDYAVALLGDRVSQFALGLQGPVHSRDWEQPASNATALLGAGDGLAVLRSDGLEIWDPQGQRTIQTRAPVDSVARTDRGWVWTTDGVVGGAPDTLWFGGATRLVAQDLDANGERLAAAIHPDAHLVGWQQDSREFAVPLSFMPLGLGLLDVDDDNAADLVVVGSAQLQVFAAAGPSPSEQRVLNRRAPAPTRPLLGVPIPLFQDLNGSLASGRTPAPRILTGGAGLAIASTMGGGAGLAASPAGAAVFEIRSGPTSPFFGMDVAPLILQGQDAGVYSHLALLTAGFTVGNAHLRAGPSASVGLVGLGAGGRFVWTPFETRSGIVHGFESRMSVNVPNFGVNTTPVGELMVMYVTSLAMGGSDAFDTRLPSVVSTSPGQRQESFGLCRRFGFSFGAVGGGSDTSLAWEFVGSRIPFEASATPAAAGFCESGVRMVDMLFSLESAPWYRYRVPWSDDAGDTTLRQMGSATVGVQLGNDTVRIGPTATAGIWALGAGGRVAFTPIHTKSAGHHGIEARAMLLRPSMGSWQGGLFYTVWMDPRR